MGYFLKSYWALVPLGCATFLIQSAISAVLQSETWRNAGQDGRAGTHTEYRFNSKGLLIQKDVYEGLDQTGPLAFQTEYSYDGQGHLLSEASGPSGNLGSKIQYLYTPTGKTEVMVFQNGDGTEKFRDSLFYGPSGALTEQRSYQGRSLICKRRFGYQGGKLGADTIFEAKGVEWLATQSAQYGYDAAGRCVQEIRSLILNGQGYAFGSKQFQFDAAGLLTMEREYQGFGPTAILISTLSYGYSETAQKIKQEQANADGSPLSATQFAWMEAATGIHDLTAAEAAQRSLKNIKGQYITAPGSSLRLLDLQGRQIYSARDILSGQAIRLSAPAILTKPRMSGYPQSSRSR